MLHFCSFNSSEHAPVDASMYATLLHSAPSGVNHSKVPDRRGIPLQPFRNVRRMVICNGGSRWTPVEDGKHKAQDVGQAIEHRLPGSPSL